MLDAFDPNTWADDAREYRIYASNDPDYYVDVDQPDYSFLAQNRWSIHSKSYGNGRWRNQLYLRRSVSDFYDSDGEMYESRVTGRLVRNRRRVQRNLFLHFVVMLRKMIDENCYPLNEHYCIVDHKDRNSRNCRRYNLQWATLTMSNLNKVRSSQ